jgi:hypothetical protein
MVKYLVIDTTKKLNFFPAKHGVSRYYSPRMILHQKNLDYDKHCRYTIGSYVQAHDEPGPTNTNAPRALDCIYLRYTDNSQTGHELLHLQTNRVITRRALTAVPMTPGIVKQLQRIAQQESMPRGLKVHNRYHRLLYDSAWIDGVDFNEDAFEDMSYNESDDDDSRSEDAPDDDDLSADAYDEMDPNEINEIEQEAQESDEESDNQPEATNSEVEDEASEDESEEPDEASGHESENENEPVDDEEDNPSDDRVTTRSGRVSRAPTKYTLAHLEPKQQQVEEYTLDSARIIAEVMCQYNLKYEKKHQFLQTFSLNKGLKVFGDKGKEAALKEMQQLHDRVVFRPIRIEDMTQLERKRAMESLIFLAEKKDGRIKARTCANGSTQRDYIDRDDAASPTATNESILITGAIEAKQGRDVMTADIPNAFVQTTLEGMKDRIMMKIRGALVDILVEMSPETYKDFVVYEKGQKVLYVRMLRALYGMLISSLLYYKKFLKDIKSIGFKVNPYDPCVANRIINGKQQTVVWHVDDLKSSHLDPKVNDRFLEWLEEKYGDEKIGKVQVTRGTKHIYLAMRLDYSEKGVLKVDMTDYVESMIEDFPDSLTGIASSPWTEKLFKVDDESKKIGESRRQIFHTFVMKAMFLCKRGRQDIQPAVTFLASRVRDTNENDWFKLVRMMNYLKKTKDDVLRIEADDSCTIKWYVDAAFAVHYDFKSHTGATMTLGRGVLISISSKQKSNARSSTEAELIGVDDVITKILWTRLFIEAQGFKVKTNIVYRDNTSSMKLEKNGKASSGKRTRHFNIKFFYITDLIDQKLVDIEYCPTDEMIADYMTKALVGNKFYFFRALIMNL